MKTPSKFECIKINCWDETNQMFMNIFTDLGVGLVAGWGLAVPGPDTGELIEYLLAAPGQPRSDLHLNIYK